MLQDGRLQGRDFLLPAPAADRQGFLPCPCSRGQALCWLRALLVIGGLSKEESNKFSLASLRVTLPDMACFIGIPPEQRKDIGQWANAATAAIYRRSHRAVIEKVTDKILSDPCLCNYDPRSIHEDLRAAELDIREAIIEPPAEPSRTSFPELDDDVGSGGPAPASPAGPPSKRIRAGILLARLSWTETHDSPHGPYRLGMKTTVPKRFHLFDTRDRSIGCGWRPKEREHVHWIRDRTTWGTVRSNAPRCDRCFKHMVMPLDWENSTETPVSTGPSDLSHEDSDTGNSAASDSTSGGELSATDSDS